VTPLGNLSVDVNLRDQLLSTKKFGVMERRVDEEEHSGEMQYPYIKKIINDAKESSGKQYDIKVLPIMVGSIGTSKEESIGKLISPFLSNREIFTVISSDFCHCKCAASLPYFLNNQCMLTLPCVWTLYHSKIMQGVGDSDTRLSQRKRMGRSMKYTNL